MQQMSDFSLRIATLSFKVKFNFFRYDNGTLKHSDSESFRGCSKPISCFYHVLHHITCMTGLF